MKILDYILPAVGTLVAVAGSTLAYKKFFFETRKSRLDRVEEIAKKALKLWEETSIDNKLNQESLDLAIKKLSKKKGGKKDIQTIQEFREKRKPEIEKEMERIDLDFIMLNKEKQTFDFSKFVILTIVLFLCLFVLGLIIIAWREQTLELYKLKQ